MNKRRKKGEGTLVQRKDGRWEGRVVIGYDEDGLPKTKNVLAESKTECQKLLDQLKKDQALSAGRITQPCSPDTLQPSMSTPSSKP